MLRSLNFTDGDSLLHDDLHFSTDSRHLSIATVKGSAGQLVTTVARGTENTNLKLQNSFGVNLSNLYHEHFSLNYFLSVLEEYIYFYKINIL